ncbi:hypothetical protein B0A56_02085 [Flavobacterium columnare NBRC 100251 = ATCC 23463]|nr:hypothetical protein B0A56_02085 [Flavobacterium columnare NBRC 100251 = ATCC 23463]
MSKKEKNKNKDNHEKALERLHKKAEKYKSKCCEKYKKKESKRCKRCPMFDLIDKIKTPSK